MSQPSERVKELLLKYAPQTENVSSVGSVSDLMGPVLGTGPINTGGTNPPLSQESELVVTGHITQSTLLSRLVSQTEEVVVETEEEMEEGEVTSEKALLSPSGTEDHMSKTLNWLKNSKGPESIYDAEMHLQSCCGSDHELERDASLEDIGEQDENDEEWQKPKTRNKRAEDTLSMPPPLPPRTSDRYPRKVKNQGKARVESQPVVPPVYAPVAKPKFSKREMNMIEGCLRVRSKFWCTGCPQWQTFGELHNYKRHFIERHRKSIVKIVCPGKLRNWCDGGLIASDSKGICECPQDKVSWFVRPEGFICHLVQAHNVESNCAVHFMRQNYREWKVGPNPKYIDPGALMGPTPLKGLETLWRQMLPTVLRYASKTIPYSMADNGAYQDWNREKVEFGDDPQKRKRTWAQAQAKPGVPPIMVGGKREKKVPSAAQGSPAPMVNYDEVLYRSSHIVPSAWKEQFQPLQISVDSSEERSVKSTSSVVAPQPTPTKLAGVYLENQAGLTGFKNYGPVNFTQVLDQDNRTELMNDLLPGMYMPTWVRPISYEVDDTQENLLYSERGRIGVSKPEDFHPSQLAACIHEQDAPPVGYVRPNDRELVRNVVELVPGKGLEVSFQALQELNSLSWDVEAMKNHMDGELRRQTVGEYQERERYLTKRLSASMGMVTQLKEEKETLQTQMDQKQQEAAALTESLQRQLDQSQQDAAALAESLTQARRATGSNALSVPTVAAPMTEANLQSSPTHRMLLMNHAMVEELLKQSRIELVDKKEEIKELKADNKYLRDEENEWRNREKEWRRTEKDLREEARSTSSSHHGDEPRE